jgi:hypothetical protein
MRRLLLLAFMMGLICSFIGIVRLYACAVDLSGTWVFSVDLETGEHGNPTFVFTQKGESLTGTYKGPLGEQKVSGTMKGKKVVFSFNFSRDGQTFKAIYTGIIETPIKMTGAVEFGTGQRGKWTATKKDR